MEIGGNNEDDDGPPSVYRTELGCRLLTTLLVSRRNDASLFCAVTLALRSATARGTSRLLRISHWLTGFVSSSVYRRSTRSSPKKEA